MTTNESKTTQIHIFESKYEKVTLVITDGKAFKIEETSWFGDQSNEITMNYARIEFKTLMARVKSGEKNYSRIS